MNALFPKTAQVVAAPVRQVTLLEDRAQVERGGTVTLPVGQHKVVVADVSPVLQDLSLRAAASANAKVVDARLRRAMRVTPHEQPEQAKRLELDLEALTEKLRRLQEDRALTLQRKARVDEVLERGFTELPEDVSWGLAQTQWKDTLEALFERGRQLSRGALELQQLIEQATIERQRLIDQRQAFDRPDTQFTAWVEADIVVSAAGPVELTFDYTVPNALWRPVHSARLVTGAQPSFTFESRASVWQNTGEDWVDVRLVFSTARASLGIEPPLLSDDLLTAQKKSEKLVVQAREVVIQKAKVAAGPGASAAAPSTVELPGVDDGGEIRTLEAKGRCTVPSDGRPNTVPLFEFSATPSTKVVAFPELELRAFLTSTQPNGSRFPILAGPVELLLENGFVGWTKVLFVAPGEQFSLSFGPDASIRLARTDRDREQEATLEKEKWKTVTTTVWLYLSNLGDEPKKIEVTERMPVSEIAQVKVELGARRTTPKPKVDENGFATWVVELPGNEQSQITFAYDVATAPGVQGMD